MKFIKKYIFTVGCILFYIHISIAQAQLISDDDLYLAPAYNSQTEYRVTDFVSFIKGYSAPSSREVARIVDNGKISSQTVHANESAEEQNKTIVDVQRFAQRTSGTSTATSSLNVPPQISFEEGEAEESETESAQVQSDKEQKTNILKKVVDTVFGHKESDIEKDDGLVDIEKLVKADLSEPTKDVVPSDAGDETSEFQIVKQDRPLSQKPINEQAILVETEKDVESVIDNVQQSDNQKEDNVSHSEKSSEQSFKQKIKNKVNQMIGRKSSILISANDTPAEKEEAVSQHQTIASDNGGVLISGNVKVPEQQSQEIPQDSNDTSLKENIEETEEDIEQSAEIDDPVEPVVSAKMEPTKSVAYPDIPPTLIKGAKNAFFSNTAKADIAPVVTKPKSADDESSTDEEEPEISRSKYLIVKFKTDWPYQLESSASALFAADRPFQHHFSDASASIDGLNERVGVKSITSVFQNRKDVTTEEAIFQRAQLSAKLKQVYAKRQSRVSPGVEAPLPSSFVNVYRLEVPEDSDLEEIAALYASDPHVEYAEPDELMRPHYDPDDEHFWLQWGAENTGIFGGSVVDADIDATDAWDLEFGDGIVVAINDSGIAYNHEDLTGNIWTNTDETFNGADSDGNGYIDDIRGWDFTTCTELNADTGCVGVKSPDNDPFDNLGHGTHVGGTVGAVDNTIGVVGIAPKVQIMAVKALTGGDGIGYTTHLAQAIVYAVDNGADIVNNSWGSSSDVSSIMVTTIAYARANGVLLVFSAGNDDETVNPNGTCAQEGVLCVGATTVNDSRLIVDNPGTEDDWGSNYGASVDLSAPGRWVYSTVIDEDAQAIGIPYNYKSGTSMAAPHVSGAAALLLAYHEDKNFTSDQVIEILKATTDDVGIPLFGTGRLNAHRALLLDGLEPVLTPIGDKMAITGDTLLFSILASDPSDDPLTLSAELSGGGSIASLGANLIDNGNGTGTFSWTPPSAQAGTTHDIVFTVTDSPTLLTDSETITITVIAGDECGNGELEGDEECDDGNTNDGDGCTSECIEEICGDGVINNNGTEECDDGGTDVGDGCNAMCEIEECGNGVIDFGEGCDDGNTANGDGCNSLCFAEFCGDGSVNNNGAEQCDDGNISDGDGCSSMCMIEAVCGDGVIGLFEQCDDGNTAVGDGCNDICQLEECGNGTVDFGEECDDGNEDDGDGCTSACVEEICGDGVVNNDGAEQCDDGNIIVGDGCNTLCQIEECGNGTVDFGEECDDGNEDDNDGCSSVCVEEFCGDGVVNNGTEQCDDGGTAVGDGCNATCQLEECGNGTVDFGEACDDGNEDDGDGCTSACVEEICGDGVVNNNGAEQCDDGNTTEGDGCNDSCQLEECGNGTIDFGEQCDDNNLVDGDGCTSACVTEYCGDGIVNNAGSEECDDGNDDNQDGCWDNCEIHGFCGDGNCDIIEGENCGSCQIDCGYCRGLRPR